MIMLYVAAAVLLAGGCSVTNAPAKPGTSGATAGASAGSTSSRPVDYDHMEAQLKTRIEADPELVAVRSVLISVDGSTVVSYFQNAQPDERRHVWSVTKSVLSILVGIAIDERLLNVDTTLAESLPEHASAMSVAQRSVTVRQLLNMTGGWPGDDGGLNLATDDTVGQILTYGLSNEPGETFLYSNISTHLLAAVLRQAIDRSILDYAREKLFDPLDIETRPGWQGWDLAHPKFTSADFGWAMDRSGIHTGGFGLKLRPADMIKIGELYLNDGRWHDRQIVSADWVRSSTTLQLTPEQETDGPYGYLWWLGEENGHPAFGAYGSFGQRIVCIPDLGLVLVVSATDDTQSQEALGDVLDEAVLREVVMQPLTNR